MKIRRRSAKPLLLSGPKRSRVKIGPRGFVVFIIIVLVSAAIGISLNLYFEEREVAHILAVAEGRR